MRYVRPFTELRATDVAEVGGKNASLGELISQLTQQGIRVPLGFASTADAYREFFAQQGLDQVVDTQIAAWRAGSASLAQASQTIRTQILAASLQPAFQSALIEAYQSLCRESGKDALDVAVRSSATAEDLPDASFAGQHESYLNIHGEAALLDAIKHCIASVFTERAISYRENLGFDHLSIALSAGVQRMVRSDLGASGVMFSIDTESGFPDAALINATWGLGEPIVQGQIVPDEYMVHKPLLQKEGAQPIIEKSCGTKTHKMVYQSEGPGCTLIESSSEERAKIVLSDDEICQLARWAVLIETHYGCPMDIEWARDGMSGQLFVVQARPETVQSREAASFKMESYQITQRGKYLFSGLAVGKQIATGRVMKVSSPHEITEVPEDAILVTETTNPDWVPLMKAVRAVITDQGGRTSHAAIVSRELRLPAIVGASNATKRLEDGQLITVSCAEGTEGHVYEGAADFVTREIELDKLPETQTRLMLNLSDPSAACSWWRLPSRGVGLARMEFIISNHIKIHPMALVDYKTLPEGSTKQQIDERTTGYSDKKDYFVERLSRGIARIAAMQYPQPTIVRMSDFKSNEYAQLIGGELYEPKEENPMLGWRGASRYYHPDYKEGFALECQAIKRARELIGMDNIKVMIPFCRTLGEAERVHETLAEHGLKRGQDGLEVYVMCEIPANVILAEDFAEYFDGFSIGSNDLTQLILGVDRDSERMHGLFNEDDPAVTRMIRRVIQRAQSCGRPVGFCGQAPSDRPDFAQFLVEAGINSISVTPDSFIDVIGNIARAEAKQLEPVS